MLNADDAQAIINRVEALEKQNRRLKGVGIAVCLTLATVVLMGLTTPSRTIEAQRFALVDGAGHTRAALGFEKDDLGSFPGPDVPALTLYTENGKPGARLIEYGSTAPITVFNMFDAEGRKELDLDGSRVIFSNRFKGGETMLATDFLSISRPGWASVWLGFPTNGEPHLSVFDSEGNSTHLGVETLTDNLTGAKTTTSGAHMSASTKDGTITWSTDMQQQVNAVADAAYSRTLNSANIDEVKRDLSDFEDGVCSVLRAINRGQTPGKLYGPCLGR